MKGNSVINDKSRNHIFKNGIKPFARKRFNSVHIYFKNLFASTYTFLLSKPLPGHPAGIRQRSSGGQ